MSSSNKMIEGGDPKTNPITIADEAGDGGDGRAMNKAIVPSGLADNVMKALWSEMPITERFGDLKGICMMEKIIQAYQIGERRTCPFYVVVEVIKTRNIVRHAKNDRRQASVELKIRKQMISN